MVKGRQFGNYRDTGDPVSAARIYNAQYVDELAFIDIDATNESRATNKEIILKVSKECFMPLTIGGGINSVDAIRELLLVGADKVIINTAAYTDENLIRESSEMFGKQCIIIGIDVKLEENQYVLYKNSGRIRCDISLKDHLKKMESIGAGEFFINNFGNSSGNKSFLQSNTIIAKLAFLILVVFVFVILLRVGTAVLSYIFTPSSDPILLNGMKDGTSFAIIPVDPSQPNAVPILRSKNEHDGLVFTWSSWIFLKQPDLQNNTCAPGACSTTSNKEYRHIYSKGSDIKGTNGIMKPNNAPGLYVTHDHTTLAVVVSTFDNPNEKILINDLPIGHWMNVIIRQDQHRLDIFINGMLTRSTILPSIPNQNYDPVFLGLNGGFQGYLSQLQYFARALGANKIKQLVDAGPSLKTVDGNLKQTDAHYLSFRWFFPLQSGEMQ